MHLTLYARSMQKRSFNISYRAPLFVFVIQFSKEKFPPVPIKIAFRKLKIKCFIQHTFSMYENFLQDIS